MMGIVVFTVFLNISFPTSLTHRLIARPLGEANVQHMVPNPHPPLPPSNCSSTAAAALTFFPQLVFFSLEMSFKRCILSFYGSFYRIMEESC